MKSASMRWIQKTFWLGLAGVMALAGAVAPRAESPETSRGKSVLQNFITCKGDKLMDGDKEFRFMGANMPGMIMPYDWTLYLPERMALPTPWELEDGFKTLAQMGLRVVRWWNLPVRGPKEGEMMAWKYVQAPGKFNDKAFETIDHALALANKHGIRIIFDLTADMGDYLGGIGTYAEWRGKSRAAFYTDPQLKEDFKATLRYVLNRKNSVSGIPYKDDKSILAWQFGNEMGNVKIPESWHAEMAALMKRIDPNHLIMYGRNYLPPQNDANIEVVDIRHFYGGNWRNLAIADRKASRGKWPYVIGEFGPYIGKAADAEPVMRQYRELLDTVIAEGISGALIWSMYFHHERGGFYWHQIMTYPSVWSYHWPGFPSGDFHREREVMRLLREAAFKIQGLDVPPIPIPEAPRMLPVAGGVPLLSWQGSVGAMGYDIQRAGGADGPWQVIASNVSDADIAYRPLFSDTGVKAGQSCYYRVLARNDAGVSAPSSAIGPVKVERICLADELQDFTRVAAKSDGLTVNNEYNAMYMEYLFRAKGEAGQWLTYQVPTPMESVNVVAFSAPQIQDLELQVSTDGESFTTLKPERKERPLPAPPGGAARGQRRTMIRYECAVPAGNHYLKVRWTGPAELDRVEIYYPGAK